MYLDESCPLCGGDIVLLSTTNEWKYQCEKCKARFNDKREKLERSTNSRFLDKECPFCHQQGVSPIIGASEFKYLCEDCKRRFNEHGACPQARIEVYLRCDYCGKPHVLGMFFDTEEKEQWAMRWKTIEKLCQRFIGFGSCANATKEESNVLR